MKECVKKSNKHTRKITLFFTVFFFCSLPSPDMTLCLVRIKDFSDFYVQGRTRLFQSAGNIGMHRAF